MTYPLGMFGGLVSHSRNWTPGSHSDGPNLWYDFAYTSNQDNIISAGNVQQWGDRSRNSFHLTQGTASRRPRSGDDTINGLDVLSVTDNLSLNIALSGMAASSGLDLYIVRKHDNTGSGQACVLDDTGGLGEWRDDSGFGAWVRNDANDIQVNAETIDTEIHLHNIRKGGSNTKLFVDGSQKDSNQTLSNPITLNLIRVNEDVFGATNSGIDGKICEIIFYDKDLGDTNRHNIEGYLAHKWGFAHKLPLDHPYKYDGRKFGFSLLFFDPTHIGADAWWDPSDAAETTVISGEYDAINDKSGNGHTMTAPSAARRPSQFTINSLDALDVINTGASGDVLQVAAAVIDDADDYTIFALCQSGGTFGRGADGFGDGWSIATNNLSHNATLDSGGAATYTANAPNGVVSVGMLDQNGAQEISHATNGDAYTTVSAPKTDLRTSTRFEEMGTSNGSSVAGKLGDVVIIKRLATTEEKQLMEGYIAWKWGKEGNLPVGHPYELDGSLFGF